MNALFSDVSPRNGARRRGWVFYDGGCAFCTSLARCLEPALLRRGFHCAALQEPWVAILLGLSREELLQLASRQRYGLHAMQDEHFGIAVGDMLRAGCLPFVHNSGG